MQNIHYWNLSREHQFLERWFLPLRRTTSAGSLEFSTRLQTSIQCGTFGLGESMASLRLKKEEQRINFKTVTQKRGKEKKRKRYVLCLEQLFPIEHECSGWIQSDVVPMITRLNGKYTIF